MSEQIKPPPVDAGITPSTGAAALEGTAPTLVQSTVIAPPSAPMTIEAEPPAALELFSLKNATDRIGQEQRPKKVAAGKASGVARVKVTVEVKRRIHEARKDGDGRKGKTPKAIAEDEKLHVSTVNRVLKEQCP